MADGDILVLLNTEMDANLVSQGLAREWVNRVQKLRKSGGLLAADKIEVFYEPIASDKPAKKVKAPKGKKGAPAPAAMPTPSTVIVALGSSIGETLKTPAPTVASAMQAQMVVLASEEIEIDGEKFQLSLTRQSLGFNAAAVEAAAGGDAALASDVVQMLSTMDYPRFATQYKSGGAVTCKLGDGPEGDVATVVLEVGKSVFLSVSEASRA